MDPTPRICAYCDANLPEGHHYCARCGARWSEDDDDGMQTLFYGPMQAPGRAKLMLITGSGIEGISYHLNTTHHICGYKANEIPFDDPYLSRKHTDFFYRDNQLYIRDQDSLNGTFVRIREPWALRDGDMIRAGDHFFRYQRLELPESDELEPGTAFYASPRPKSGFRVAEVVDGGVLGRAYASPHAEVAVGRDNCDMTYPDDVHMSARHFKIATRDGGDVLLDLDSHNGTFVRIRDEHRLEHGDYVFIGQQLLRVEIGQ